SFVKFPELAGHHSAQEQLDVASWPALGSAARITLPHFSTVFNDKSGKLCRRGNNHRCASHRNLSVGWSTVFLDRRGRPTEAGQAPLELVVVTPAFAADRAQITPSP